MHGSHKRSQAGAVGNSQGGEKMFRRNLQRKFVSAPPAHQVHLHRQSMSQFLRHFFAGRGRFGGVSTVVHLVAFTRFYTVC